MKTNHNCIVAIRKGLMSAEGISDVEIHLANIQDITKQDSIVKTGQKLSYVQQITLKNGEKRNKKVNTFLTHVYCPFCGQEYIGENYYIFFKIQKNSDIERMVYTSKDTSKKAIDNYFEEACGGIYKWSVNKSDLENE